MAIESSNFDKWNWAGITRIMDISGTTGTVYDITQRFQLRLGKEDNLAKWLCSFNKLSIC